MSGDFEDDDALIERLGKDARGDWVRLVGIARRRVVEMGRSERWRLERRIEDLARAVADLEGGFVGRLAGGGVCLVCERRREASREATRRWRRKRGEGG